VFTTHGHYGSTAFDPADRSALRISVCDKCLLVKAWPEYGAVWHEDVVYMTPTVRFSRPWEPDDYDDDERSTE
jgi:hypothetical protein